MLSEMADENGEHGTSGSNRSSMDGLTQTDQTTHILYAYPEPNAAEVSAGVERTNGVSTRSFSNRPPSLQFAARGDHDVLESLPFDSPKEFRPSLMSIVMPPEMAMIDVNGAPIGAASNPRLSMHAEIAGGTNVLKVRSSVVSERCA
jgi:hypothetical protein